MNWEILATIIARYSLEVAALIFARWSSGRPPTPQDFIELRALASQTAQDRMKAKLTELGIPLDSDQAKGLLALT